MTSRAVVFSCHSVNGIPSACSMAADFPTGSCTAMSAIAEFFVVGGCTRNANRSLCVRASIVVFNMTSPSVLAMTSGSRTLIGRKRVSAAAKEPDSSFCVISLPPTTMLHRMVKGVLVRASFMRTACLLRVSAARKLWSLAKGVSAAPAMNARVD